MNYRHTHLLAEQTSLTTGTKIIDVNVKDVISRIWFKWGATMLGEGMDSYPHKDITKIELIDGSDVLFSMDGGQCQALNIYDRKVGNAEHGQYLGVNTALALFSLDFGRFLYDPLLALDPQQFRNLQLKITYNYRVMDTGCTDGKLEVYAELFDEKVVTPIGLLVSKEHFTSTPPSSGYTYIDLPTDLIIRKMLIQGYYSGYAPWTNISEVKLDEDNEKRIPFDWNLEDYARMMKSVWTPIHQQIVGMVAVTDRTFYGLPTDYYAQLNLQLQDVTQRVAPVGWASGGKVAIKTSDHETWFWGIWTGWLPNHCFEFPFGNDQDLDDWYDVTKLGSLKLRIKGASANGSQAVVLQQLRRY